LGPKALELPKIARGEPTHADSIAKWLEKREAAPKWPSHPEQAQSWWDGHGKGQSMKETNPSLRSKLGKFTRLQIGGKRAESGEHTNTAR